MYICKEHGKKEVDWCDECEVLLSCDCSDVGYDRKKDLEFDIGGKKTVLLTVEVTGCLTCSKVISVAW